MKQLKRSICRGWCKVELTLFQVDDLEISKPQGICIDDLMPERLEQHPDATLLKLDESDEEIEVELYSHLLRSNCPVTGQPDWGTVLFVLRAKTLLS